ncbi:hypothetical protein C8R41DRAFT_923927 [Lentinula lateritia]|uniref:G domain-containing protein n=1 Tax=Lentinula lateritia TaxID=40482 RepID=A0ABQ8V4N2_9AGAR|nr:hypothetical protein C8R41DRAFT_923927 [Lentinula lateritia]
MFNGGCDWNLTEVRLKATSRKRNRTFTSLASSQRLLMSQPSTPDAPNIYLANTAGEVPSRQMIIEPWTKQQMNIVLLGETGVGKTDLVNLIANVCAGATPENFVEKIELISHVSMDTKSTYHCGEERVLAPPKSIHYP